jgi:hypothetical protein
MQNDTVVFDAVVFDPLALAATPDDFPNKMFKHGWAMRK